MTSVVNRKSVLNFLTLCSLCFTGCNFFGARRPAPTELRGEAFGSYFVVKYVGDLDPESFDRELGVFFNGFNAEFSTYQDDSTVSKFNRVPKDQRLTVSPRFIQMLEFAKDLHRSTNGAFDPTLAPVIKLWGFGGGVSKSAPTEAELSEALSRVGIQHVHWEDLQVWKTKLGLMLDLNAFAPGWAADLMGEMLERHGIKSYMIDISGELRLRGEKSPGEAWVVGIEKPALRHGEAVQLALGLRDQSIATSGDYRQFFDEKGQRRSHIIDPRTGRPVTHGVSSATVIAPDTMLADGWSTALMVLGKEGIELAEATGLKVYLLEAKGPGDWQPFVSPSMQKLMDSESFP